MDMTSDWAVVINAVTKFRPAAAAAVAVRQWLGDGSHLAHLGFITTKTCMIHQLYQEQHLVKTAPKIVPLYFLSPPTGKCITLKGILGLC